MTIEKQIEKIILEEIKEVWTDQRPGSGIKSYDVGNAPKRITQLLYGKKENRVFKLPTDPKEKEKLKQLIKNSVPK